MKNTMKKLVSILLALSVLASLSLSAFAVSGNTRCHIIGTENITAYKKSDFSKKAGTIYPSDELYVQEVTSAYSIVSYPPDKGGRRTAFIPTSAILWGTGGDTVTASGRVTTYVRPGGDAYGYVDAGDQTTILGVSDDWWQVKYPASSGYKYAFLKADEAASVLGGGYDAASITAANGSMTNALYGIDVSDSYIS